MEILRICVCASTTHETTEKGTSRCAFISAFQRLFIRPIISNQLKVTALRRGLSSRENKKEVEKWSKWCARAGIWGWSFESSLDKLCREINGPIFFSFVIIFQALQDRGSSIFFRRPHPKNRTPYPGDWLASFINDAVEIENVSGHRVQFIKIVG